MFKVIRGVNQLLDKLIIEFDKMLKVLTTTQESIREHPDVGILDSELSDNEKRKSIGLMRVNHTGEICAQGLYQGQSLTSRDPSNKEAFEKAAFEEIEHLAWTEQRLNELGGKPSILNPLFYLGSLTIGIAAGIVGDKWNLGFLEETESQVEQHLAQHMLELPKNDTKSLAIVKQMKIDEAKHKDMAHDYGAVELPILVKNLMKISSKVMTFTTYRI